MSRFMTLSNGVVIISSILFKDVQSTVVYFWPTAFIIALMLTTLNPRGGGAIVVARVVPRLLTIVILSCSLALCHVSCLLLPYWAMEMAGPIIPVTIGLWVGSTGRVAMVVVAGACAVATVIVVFAGYASHSTSVITRVRRPVG